MNAGLWKLQTYIISWCAACVYSTHKYMNVIIYVCISLWILIYLYIL